MYYIVYRTTNLINDKIYIGRHVSENPIDTYLGSGHSFLRALKKYGKDNFVRENLFVFDNFEEMLIKEGELVTPEFILQEDNYNLIPGGKGYKMTDEVKKKISISASGKIRTKEHCEKISNSLTGKIGRTHSEETKIKMSKSHIGQVHPPRSEESRKRYSEAAKKRTYSEETRKKMSDSRNQFLKEAKDK